MGTDDLVTFSHNDGTPAVALHFSKWYRSDSPRVACSTLGCSNVFTEEGAPVARVVSAPYICIFARSGREPIVRACYGRKSRQASPSNTGRCYVGNPVLAPWATSLHAGFWRLCGALGVAAEIPLRTGEAHQSREGDAAVEAVIRQDVAASEADAAGVGAALDHGEFRHRHNPISTTNLTR